MKKLSTAERDRRARLSRTLRVGAARRKQAYESLGRLIAAWARIDLFYPVPLELQGGKILVAAVTDKDFARLKRIATTLGLQVMR